MNKIIDAVEEAIDAFEATWSPDRIESIEKTLDDWGLSHDAETIAEIARIDIERRYYNGLTCSLDRYLSRFPALAADEVKSAEVAYEDFRVRLRLGHPVAPERYRSITGLESHSWYRELCRELPSSPGWSPLEVSKSREPIATSRLTPIDESNVAPLLERIGFSLLRPLGHGAFGSVYLACQNDLAERKVVLKLVRQSHIEPQMMAMLQHTNIVPIYSYHWIDSVCVICMPYAGELTLRSYMQSLNRAESRNGRSIVQTIRRCDDDTMSVKLRAEEDGPSADPTHPQPTDAAPLQRLSQLNREQLAIFLFSRLASALAHSHDRSVLHSDIKPANILIREDGEPALLDFNLSRSTKQCYSTTVGGTYAYMAPETLRELLESIEFDAKVSLIDQRSDIYSLGVVMFEFMTGRAPFPLAESGTPEHLPVSLSTRNQSPAWSPDDEVSGGLQSIIDRCLTYEANDRYSEASHLQHDLQNHSSHMPLRYTDEPLAEKLFKFTHRHPKYTSGVIASIALVILLFPMLWVIKSTSDRSDQHQSIVQFTAFEDASNNSLMNSLVDPQRFEPQGIAAMMEPLESFSVMSPETSRNWLNPEAQPITIFPLVRLVWSAMIHDSATSASTDLLSQKS